MYIWENEAKLFSERDHFQVHSVTLFCRFHSTQLSLARYSLVLGTSENDVWMRKRLLAVWQSHAFSFGHTILYIDIQKLLRRECENFEHSAFGSHSFALNQTNGFSRRNQRLRESVKRWIRVRNEMLLVTLEGQWTHTQNFQRYTIC